MGTTNRQSGRLHTPRPPWLAWLAVGLALLPGCGEQPARRVDLPGQVHSGRTVRDIRVLILEGTASFRVRIEGPYVIRTPATGVLARGKDLPWVTVSRVTGDFTVGNKRWPAGSIDLVPTEGSRVLVSQRTGGKWGGPLAFGGFLRCSRASNTTMDVVNVVDLDLYVAGVIARELYGYFEPEAFRAQAVAARTYALWHMARNTHRDFDVRATEASQVYGGLPTGPGGRKAYDAVNHTRGVVCTWTSPEGERIFCTFYSAACGGRTQSAANAFHAENIPPLAGGVHCDYCRIAQQKSAATSKAYRWGPESVSKAELARRLSRRYSAFRSFGAVERVEISRRNKAGRPAEIRVVSRTGRQRTLSAEEFRLAVGGRTMRSSDCDIVNTPQAVKLCNGRGFGHGVGLCQWGAQGQALLGRKAGQILKFYYPGMHLTRAY